MEEKTLPAGNYTVIVVGARVEHYPSGSYIIILDLVVTQGEQKYDRCRKLMFYQDKPEQLALAKSHFARIGGRLADRSTVDKDAQSLVGNVLSVSVYYTEHGKQRVMVKSRIGMDDPLNYCKEGNKNV